MIQEWEYNARGQRVENNDTWSLPGNISLRERRVLIINVVYLNNET